MIRLISAYLLQNKSVSLPGLGTIYVEQIPAQSDFINRQILPPAYHFRFDKYFDTPGKDFFLFLSARQQVADFESIRIFNEWAQELRSAVAGPEQSVALDGIGSLSRNSSGDVVFEPAGKPETYAVPVPAERLIRSNARHAIIVGDRETTNVEMTGYLQDTLKEKASWWIYVLIIAAIAGVALFFLTR